ncbi:MAG: hypothetical protein KKG75_01330 [Nanoarchaeota archaeon]|nr:hypothetical protein [Nanoarchaeota archaeon]
MPTCPNCGFELVLLNRPKYKCSLCSKLYPQQQVESYNFRNWNKKQKENDLHNLKLEEKKMNKLIQENKTLKAFRFLFNERRIKQSIEKKLQRKQEYYFKNKQIINLKRDIRRQNNLEVYNKMRKNWRDKNLETMRIYGQIQHYRSRQKALALQYLKNNY